MPTPAFVCSRTYGGCGYVGSPHDWQWYGGDNDMAVCPQCSEDHAFQLVRENFVSLMKFATDEEYRLAERLMTDYYGGDNDV